MVYIYDAERNSHQPCSSIGCCGDVMNLLRNVYISLWKNGTCNCRIAFRERVRRSQKERQ